MIEVSYERRRPALTVTGHAMAGPYGADIVCAAASMLAQTLLAVCGGEKKPGRMRLVGRPEDGPVFAAMATGFRLLAEAYPQHVRYEESEPPLSLAYARQLPLQGEPSGSV